MTVIIGYLIVLFSVFGGYAMAGGHLAALLQPIELLMIGGAALGAFIVGNDTKTIKATMKALPLCFKSSTYSKQRYMDLLAFNYEVLSKLRKDGAMALEKDINDYQNSEIFKRYPSLIEDEHLMEFVVDYLRLLVTGNMDAFQIENLMDNEIDTHHHEAMVPSGAIARAGDAMPAFGIVAAVMGVVHTMESIGIPPSELGILIAHALVGTFLGILLAYGFVGPLASLLAQKAEESSKMFQCVKVTFLANLHGYAPQIAVEFGRKVLYSTERPQFQELEDRVKQTRAR